MSLSEAYTGVRVMETAANYAAADAPLREPGPALPPAGMQYYNDDYDMWQRLLRNDPGLARATLQFGPAVLSEWVARVPGLYWKPESDALRRLSPEAIETRRGNWTQYVPMAKSQAVLGGVGTLRLPPGDDGSHLVSLTTQMNVSAGVPALVSADVWDKICSPADVPIEGRLLFGSARWRPMAAGWASHFPSTRGLPRGYLVLDSPDKITVGDQVAAVQVHPFTIMEYYSGPRELFDFVYATGFTSGPDYRGELADFFDHYKDDFGRHGRYLLSGDIVDPLWDAQYDSPADLRRADPAAPSQLELLEARVRERLLGGDTIDRLLEALGTIVATPADLQRLSNDAGIPPAIWYHGGSLAEAASQLVDEAVRQDRLDALIEVTAHQYPSLIRKEPR